MPDFAFRLARLRELANKTSTPEYGREAIAGLLAQEPGNAAATCPRYAAIAEHAGDRSIIVSDDLGELITELCNGAADAISRQPEAIVDLDTGTRHEAERAMRLTFRPPLPLGVFQPVVEVERGTRPALRLLLDVAEEHRGDNQELAEAIAIGDRLFSNLTT
jgi:hypothetical protein